MVDDKTPIMTRDGTGSFEEKPVTTRMRPGALEGSRIGRYIVGRLLGTGGGSHVYEAHDQTLQRKVALKVLLGGERDWTRQALKEARAQAMVDHEFICKVYDVDSWGGTHYIAMQYINGAPLDEVAGDMTLIEKVEIMRRILVAVDAAHRRGLIHRDLKPGNIIVERNAAGFWKPYVTDFGLARELEASKQHSHSGRIHGTPAYMAPEQAKGENIRDTHSDIYSLSATFYKLLCGKAPFRGNNAVAVMLQVVQADAPSPRSQDPSIPREIEAIVMRGMRKSPEDRFDSAGEFARELTRFLQNRPVESLGDSPLYHMRKFAQRHRMSMVIGGLCLVLIAAFSTVIVRDRMHVRRQGLYLERFMEQVQAIQWQMRIAQMLPVHDIRPERRLIRDRMAAIESDMTRLGTLAQGPGHYALGRGFLALGEPEQAVKYLERARDQVPWKDQVHYAWGEARCRIYYEKLREVRRIRNASVRERAVARLKADYLTPALEAMRRGRRDQIQPRDFVEAQIAYFEGRNADALEPARATFQQKPWFYEALLLQAEVHMQEGRDQVNAGARDMGRAAFNRAGEVLDQALTIAASDLQLYLTDCERLTWLMELDLTEGTDFEAGSQALIDRAAQGLQVDPGSARLESYRAYAWFKRGEQLFYYRESDPTEALEQARLYAQRAVDADPMFSWGYQYFGHAVGLLAEYRQSVGEDAWDDLSMARDAYLRAYEVEPDNVSILSGLGVTSWQMADLATRSGRDPDPHIDLALKRFNDTLTLYPDYYQGHNNLGLVYWTAAEAALLRGNDAQASFQAAADAFQKAIDLSNYDLSVANLAELNIVRARAAMAAGRDVADFLQDARAACRTMLETNDQYAHPYELLVQVCLLEAEAAVRHGADPSVPLEEARTVLGAQAEKRDLRESQALYHAVLARLLFAREAPHRDILTETRRGERAVDALDPGFDRAVLEGSLALTRAWVEHDQAAEARALQQVATGYAGNALLRLKFTDYDKPPARPEPAR